MQDLDQQKQDEVGVWYLRVSTEEDCWALAEVCSLLCATFVNHR